MNQRSCMILIAALVAGAFILFSLPPPASANDVTIFGKTYTRSTQKPQVFIDTFDFSQPGDDFMLVVKNGRNGSYRVSAALIWINGKKVVDVSDFNNQVDLITRQVSLNATNEIKVELRSKPGDFININIIGLDINVPPVANAGPDQTVLIGQTVTLDGSGSTDANLDPLTYSWSFVSCPSGSTASLTNPISINPTFQIDKPGTYVVQLVVNDGIADSAPDTVTITTVNSPPGADAGQDQSVHAGSLVRLDGSGSSDVDGDILTFSWSFVEIPDESAAVLSGSNAVDPTFTADLPGNYIVQLMVNDGHANSTPDTITISTLNSPPVANAGPDQSVVLGKPVTLDGSGSTDVDGDPLTYHWTLTDKPAGSTAMLSDTSAVKPTFTADKAGTYVAHLFVNDGLADSLQDTVVISTMNSVPVAEAGPGQSAYVGDMVTLDGSGSHDDDGDLLTYLWSFVSSPPGSTAALSDPTAVKPTFYVDKFGTYVVQLIVDDGKVKSAPDTVTITTQNSPPVADAGPDQTVYVTQTVTLDGSGSSDVDGDALTYKWSFSSRPDGSAAALSDPSAVKPTFAVDKFGTYVVQLIVNDGTADSTADTVTITTLNSAPVANAGEDQTAYVTQTLTLDGSKSSDVDGNLLTFSWSFTSRPPDSAAALLDSTAVKPAFTIDKPGTYVVQLIVNDGTVDSAPDTVTISTLNSAPVANAGEDQKAYVTQTVTLDGSESSDVDGNILIFSWSFTARPPGSAAVLSDSAAVKPAFTIDMPGTYVVQLIVNDGTVDSAPDTVTITTLNSQPVANAGPDQTAYVAQTVILDGGGSSDADGNTLTYKWSFTSLPADSAAALSNAAAVNPIFVADKRGTYVVQLIVNDGELDSEPDTVTVTTQNSPPVVNAGPDQNLTLPWGSTQMDVILDGSASCDNDGFIASYVWTGVPDPQDVAQPIIALPTGTHTFTLVVTDDEGAAASDEVVVTVVEGEPPANRPPVIQSGPPTTVLEGLPYRYDIDATDPDGDVLIYSLQNSPSGMTIDPQTGLIRWETGYGDSGSYDVGIAVSDSRGGTDSQDYTLQVLDRNRPPEITSTPNIAATEGQGYSYDVAAVDPDADPLTFSLDAGPSGMVIDNSSGLVTWNPAFDAAGDHNVTVRAADGKGSTDLQTYVVSVANVNHPPVITSTAGIMASEGQPYTYDVEAIDQDADALTYALADAPAGMSIDAATGLITWLAKSGDKGTYPVTVRVTDGPGAQASQEYTVFVFPADPMADQNFPPYFVLPDNPRVHATTLVQSDVELWAEDPDGDTLTYHLMYGTVEVTPGKWVYVESNKLGLYFDSEYPWLWVYPTAAAVRMEPYSLTFVAGDGRGGRAVFELFVYVTSTNHAPVVDFLKNVTICEGQSTDIRTYAKDQDGDPINLYVSNLPSFSSFTYEGGGFGTLTLAPDLGDAGSYPNVTVNATDGALIGNKTFSITVSAAQGAAPSIQIDEAWIRDGWYGDWTGDFPLPPPNPGDTVIMDETDLVNIYPVATDPDGGSVSMTKTVTWMDGELTPYEDWQLNVYQDGINLFWDSYYKAWCLFIYGEDFEGGREEEMLPHGTYRVTLNATDGCCNVGYTFYVYIGSAAPLRATPSSLKLVDDPVQLTVTRHLANGSVQDVTSGASGTTYEVSGDSVVAVSADGLVSPVASGTAGILIKHPGFSITVPVAVARNAVGIEIMNVPRPQFNVTPSGIMGQGRREHTANLLPSGDVLITGGIQSQVNTFLYDRSQVAYVPLPTSEVFEAATGAWHEVGHMSVGRYEHQAVTLEDGRVLVMGGTSLNPATTASILSSAEIYDPATETWSLANPMAIPRKGFSAVRLMNGRVLVNGGCAAMGSVGSMFVCSDYTNVTEIFDPSTGAWSMAAQSNETRKSASHTLLKDGRVLLAGGSVDYQDKSAEIYDPATDMWTYTGELISDRGGVEAILLKSGKALLCNYEGCELFDPESESWSLREPMISPRSDTTMTLLQDGRVLATGGTRSAGINIYCSAYETHQEAEVYDPARDMWFPVGNMLDGRAAHSATLLADGSVLIAGGKEGGLGPPCSGGLHRPDRITSEIFTPSADLDALPVVDRMRIVVGFRLADGSYHKLNPLNTDPRVRPDMPNPPIPSEWRVEIESADPGIIQTINDGGCYGIPDVEASTSVSVKWGTFSDSITVNRALPPPVSRERIYLEPAEFYWEDPEDPWCGQHAMTMPVPPFHGLENRDLKVTGYRTDDSTEDLKSPSAGTAYLSTSPDVVTAAPEGVAHSVEAGPATIYALNDGRSSGLLVGVANPASFGIHTSDELLLSPGETSQLVVKLYQKLGGVLFEQDVTSSDVTSYTSQLPIFATVSTGGLVTAVANGQTNIVVRNEDGPQPAQARVRVLVGALGANSINSIYLGWDSPDITPDTLMPNVDMSEIRLIAQLEGVGNLQGIPVTFEISGPKSYSFEDITLADADGYAQAVPSGMAAAGTYTVTAHAVNPADGQTVTATRGFDIVPGVPVQLRLESTATEMIKGDLFITRLTGTDQYGNVIPLLTPESLEISVPGCQTVPQLDGGYEVICPDAGTGELSAGYGGMTATQVILINGIDTVAIYPDPCTLSSSGQTAQLTVMSYSTAGFSLDVTGKAMYASSDPSVASVDVSGLVTAQGGGIARITATYSGMAGVGEVQVSIPSATSTVTGIDLLPFASPQTVSLEGITAAAQLTGSGPLGGIRVAFDVDGFSDPNGQTGVTDASGLASVTLNGLRVADSGSVTATVENPADGASMDDTELLTLVPAPLSMISLKLDKEVILAGETIVANAQPMDSFANILEGVTIALGTTAPDASITSGDFPKSVTFPSPGVFDITATAGDITRVRRVIVKSAANEVVISDFSPAIASAGMSLSVYGAGFSSVPEQNVVLLNGESVEVVDAFPWRLLIILPESAESGLLTVSARGVASAPVQLSVEGTVPPQEPTEQEIQLGYYAGQLLIAYNNDRPLDAEMAAVASEYGIARQVYMPDLGKTLAILEDGSFSNTVSTMIALTNDNRIRFAAQRGLVKAQNGEWSNLRSQFNDPDLTYHWHLTTTNLAQSWLTLFPEQGEGITVGILDSGLDISTEDLWHEFKEPEVHVYRTFGKGVHVVSGGGDDIKHGTYVASIAAAKGNNNFRGVGVAPKARIISMNVFGAKNWCNTIDFEPGLTGLIKAGANVINMSFGRHLAPGTDAATVAAEDKFWSDAITRALAAVTGDEPILVAAAGNCRADEYKDGKLVSKGYSTDNVFPAKDRRVIAVGVLDSPKNQFAYLNTDSMAPFSNFASFVHFVAPAPGKAFLTSLDEASTKELIGTSFAAPQVTGLVALILAEARQKQSPPYLLPTQIEIIDQIRGRFSYDFKDPNKSCSGADFQCFSDIKAGRDYASGYGKIFIFDIFGITPDKVVKISPHGDALNVVGHVGFENPGDAVVTEQGDVLVTDVASYPYTMEQDGKLWRISADGTANILPMSGTGLYDPVSVDVDASGNIVLLDQAGGLIPSPLFPYEPIPTGDRVFYVNREDGSLDHADTLPGSGGFLCNDIVWGKDGNPVIAGVNTVVYDEFFPFGVGWLSAVKGTELDKLIGPPEVSLYIPDQMAVDSAGNIWADHLGAVDIATPYGLIQWRPAEEVGLFMLNYSSALMDLDSEDRVFLLWQGVSESQIIILESDPSTTETPELRGEIKIKCPGLLDIAVLRPRPRR